MPVLSETRPRCNDFAGWVNREHAQVVAYLVQENRALISKGAKSGST